MFTAALFTTAKRWKQPKGPSTDEWINKLWSVQTMEYYSGMKRNEVLTQATMWMNFANVMLSKRSQTQKATYCIVPFLGNVQNRPIHRQKVDVWLLGAGGRGVWM